MEPQITTIFSCKKNPRNNIKLDKVTKQLI